MSPPPPPSPLSLWRHIQIGDSGGGTHKRAECVECVHFHVGVHLGGKTEREKEREKRHRPKKQVQMQREELFLPLSQTQSMSIFVTYTTSRHPLSHTKVTAGEREAGGKIKRFNECEKSELFQAFCEKKSFVHMRNCEREAFTTFGGGRRDFEGL